MWPCGTALCKRWRLRTIAVTVLPLVAQGVSVKVARNALAHPLTHDFQRAVVCRLE